MILKCRYCGKECKNKNSLAQHEIRCKSNPNKIDLTYLSNRDYSNFNWNPSNQFIKAKKEERIIFISDESRYKMGKGWRGKIQSEELRRKRSESMKLAIKKYPNSYSSSNINGRVKHYEYNGYKLDGLWELEVAKYLDSKNIKWEKPNKGFEYEWNKSIHLYFPDFYLPEYDYYIEVKGFQRERDLCKWKSIKHLIVIKQKEINKIRNNKYNISIYLTNNQIPRGIGFE